MVGRTGAFGLRLCIQAAEHRAQAASARATVQDLQAQLGAARAQLAAQVRAAVEARGAVSELTELLAGKDADILELEGRLGGAEAVRMAEVQGRGLFGQDACLEGAQVDYMCMPHVYTRCVLVCAGAGVPAAAGGGTGGCADGNGGVAGGGPGGQRAAEHGSAKCAGACAAPA